MSQTTSTRRVTAADIARSLGISRATVGFVLNDTPGQTISEATRTRVLDEAKRLGYRTNIAARALASGRSRIVLLVLPDWPLDFNLRRNIEEASLALDEAGYALITYTPHPTGHSRPLWEKLQPDVVMSMTPFAPGQAESIRAAGVTRLIPDPEAPVGEEYPEEGPVLQVQYLVDLGHRSIAFAGSADPRVADLVALRRRRANDAALALGLPPLPSSDIQLTDASAGDAIDRWREAGVTAIAAYNDDVAAALVGAGLRMGLTLPRDLSVIGHDDTPLASMFEPRLSTISVNTVGLGRYLAGLALSAVENRPLPPAGPELRVALVPRASTAPLG
ncbi:DNA-binding LacI/PurR family transcriptional regulator [Agromyces ramosus]|uniref:DNA-binding LacI/PurR family transcriptional regulator n=1 Tax=Agromyces ramosus TaxID=33879 RepID=A0A4Q7MFT3_9MICO|nr:LacI family DNA-binding transcriptional regulator [Agromyces ramosus]RZS66427.1 DNA-binding LacI/PurR family transcriptional regulator [Agromyces ramosus]